MKNLRYALIVLLFVQHLANAQEIKNNFIIKGELSGKQIDSAVISYRPTGGKYIIVAVPVLGQKFTFSGNTTEPEGAAILFKNTGEVISPRMQEGKSIRIYVEPGTAAKPVVITMTGDAAELDKIKVQGSKTQDEYELLKNNTAGVRKEMEPVLVTLRNEKDHEKQAEIREQLSPFQNRIKKITYQFFMDHPNSYVTAEQARYYVSSLKLDSLKRIYANFSPELKKTEKVISFEAELKKIESGLPGSIAPGFSKTDIDGKKLSLASFKGKYVLLDFWASWCVPCRKGNPHLIELYQKYHAKGFEIIGISDDDRKPDLWKAAVAADHIGIWNHVLRGLDMDLRMKNLPNPTDISDGYGIHTLPTKILVDPSGKIVGRFGDSIGGSEEELDTMLASIYKN